MIWICTKIYKRKQLQRAEKPESEDGIMQNDTKKHMKNTMNNNMNNIMKIAIIDDSKEWRNIAARKTSAFYQMQPFNEHVEITQYESGEAFLEAGEYYDFILLDVEMPGMDGFEVAKNYQFQQNNTIIIFLSTHDELGRTGYRVNAFRYIDKQYIDEELPEALTAVWEVLHKNHAVSIRLVDDDVHTFMTSDIYFMLANRHNITIYTKNGEYVSNTPLQELEKMLLGYGFFRSHRSCLVHLEHIKTIENDVIYLSNDMTCYVSARNVRDLKKALFDYEFKYANG